MENGQHPNPPHHVLPKTTWGTQILNLNYVAARLVCLIFIPISNSFISVSTKDTLLEKGQARDTGIAPWVHPPWLTLEETPWPQRFPNIGSIKQSSTCCRPENLKNLHYNRCDIGTTIDVRCQVHVRCQVFIGGTIQNWRWFNDCTVPKRKMGTEKLGAASDSVECEEG